jgi:hypothetical protein
MGTLAPSEEKLRAYGNWEGPGGENEGNASEVAARQADLDRVQKLGDSLLDKRKEAMDARNQCGIEKEWEEDEEYYQSIDSENPEGETNVGKPISASGGPISSADSPRVAKKRSSVFVPITRPYVDAASARIADMLLPNDEMPWSLKPTPIAEEAQKADQLVARMGGNRIAPTAQAAQATAAQALPMPDGSNPQGMPAAGAPPMGTAPQDLGGMDGPAAPASPGFGSAQGGPGPLAPTAQPAGNDAMAIMQDPAAVAADNDTEKSPIEKAAEAATKQITDWLVECQYHAEFRKMLENCAKLGTGILKGPVPVRRSMQRMVKREDGSMAFEVFEIDAPATFSVDPRNFFPDPACGEDVQNGGYTWEYDMLSGRTVQELLNDESYIPELIQKVLDEGPAKQGEAPPTSPLSNANNKKILGASFGVWYFHGMVERETLRACGVTDEEFGTLPDSVGSLVPAIVTMINDTVVKAILTPLDRGGFPYDVMPWQRRAGMLWGMGVARQMRTAQRMVNAAIRAMMDNAGFTSGPFVGIRKDWIRPAGADKGKWTLQPRMVFEMTENAPETAKLSDALMFHNANAAQKELEAIFQLAMKMAEDATGLPMLLQGQQGGAPDTVGGMTILNNNGSTVLRRIARQADDYVTERHIRRYYYWLLENSDNDAAKGDFQIDASGSTALVDRELANQAMIQLLPQLRADPEIDQSQLNRVVLRANRIDPKGIYKSAAEIEKMKKTPPPPPIEVMVQESRNEGAVKVAAVREDGQNKRQENALQVQAAIHNDQQKIAEGTLQMQWETTLGNLDLQLKELAQTSGLTQDQLRAKLAQHVLSLNTQIDLHNDDMAHQRAQPDMHIDGQVATAAVEPPGRAPAGQAFEK